MTRARFSPLSALYAALDAWLWRRGIRQPAIRALLCFEALACALALAAGAAFMAVTPLLLWFGVGLAGMVWVFWGWARFFSRMPGEGLEAGVLMGALLRWGGRMLVFALALYGALRVGASPIALAAGVAFGVAVGFAAYARISRRSGA